MGETGQTGEAGVELRKALTFYASFDDEVRGDFGGGTLAPSTRQDDPERPGKFIFRDRIDGTVFRIAKNAGLRGGALEATWDREGERGSESGSAGTKRSTLV